MKKFILSIAFALFAGSFICNAQCCSDTSSSDDEFPALTTFHISSYRWRTSAKEKSWGREKKADFTIVLDKNARTFTINKGSEPEVFTIVAEGPKRFERYNLKVEDKPLQVLDSFNHTRTALFRSKDGKIYQIVMPESFYYWCYEVESYE